MARVKIRFFATYRDLAGVREFEVEVPDNTTVLSLAKLLEEKFPKLKGRLIEGDKIREETKVLINGRNIEWLGKEDTKVNDGDIVAFFPPAAGGYRDHK